MILNLKYIKMHVRLFWKKRDVYLPSETMIYYIWHYSCEFEGALFWKFPCNDESSEIKEKLPSSETHRSSWVKNSKCMDLALREMCEFHYHQVVGEHPEKATMKFYGEKIVTYATEDSARESQKQSCNWQPRVSPIETRNIYLILVKH